MALGPVALADQPREPLPCSFLSVGLAHAERFCTAASGLHDYQHRGGSSPHPRVRQSDSTSSTGEPYSHPREGEQQPACRGSDLSGGKRQQGGGSGGQGRIRGGQGTARGGPSRYGAARRQRSSSSGGTVPGKRRRGATALLASKPHANYMLAEASSTPHFSVSDTVRLRVSIALCPAVWWVPDPCGTAHMQPSTCPAPFTCRIVKLSGSAEINSIACNLNAKER